MPVQANKHQNITICEWLPGEGKSDLSFKVVQQFAENTLKAKRLSHKGLSKAKGKESAGITSFWNSELRFKFEWAPIMFVVWFYTSPNKYASCVNAS